MRMRSSLLLVLILAAAACGEDSVPTPEVDSPRGNRPDPRIIPGGGIGDGAIDGVVNLYVIDDVTREPISGAEVRVGDLAGTTGADGLFIAEGVVGPQDIVVKAAGHRKELWVGANGANVTINLELDNQATPPSATLTGTIANYDSVPFTPQANHAKVALISFSQTDKLGDPANEITTPATPGQLPGNLCIGPTCDFTVKTRTGKLALFATIFDFDSKGTDDESDDTSTIIGFAVKRNIDTATATGAQDLTVIADADLQTLAIDFASPPSGLPTRGALVGIELGTDGVLLAGTTTGTSLKVPKLAALTGATGYRLTAIATDNQDPPAQSIVFRRGLTSSTLAAGTWLAPPSGITLTKQGGSWTNAAGATVHSIELSQGATRILNVTVFDSSRTSFDMPDLVTLPSGPVEAVINAFAAEGFDVTNFALDEDETKIDRVGGQQTTIN
jgi:hypothetical protein